MRQISMDSYFWRVNLSTALPNMHMHGKRRKGGQQNGKIRSDRTRRDAIIEYDCRYGRKSKCVAHEDKGRPIPTWRRHISEKVRI